MGSKGGILCGNVMLVLTPALIVLTPVLVAVRPRLILAWHPHALILSPAVPSVPAAAASSIMATPIVIVPFIEALQVLPCQFRERVQSKLIIEDTPMETGRTSVPASSA